MAGVAVGEVDEGGEAWTGAEIVAEDTEVVRLSVDSSALVAMSASVRLFGPGDLWCFIYGGNT